MARMTKAQQTMMDTIRKHYAVGNVVYVAYWRNHDRIVSLKADDLGNWQVLVETVRQDASGQWVAVDDPRWHCTMPSKGDRVVSTR